MENLNIFGKNQEEIGSLDKNLVLRTKGRVYIRFGRKYIELIDDKGNINVKIPKVLTKVDSKDKIKGTGFFLFDGDLYACYEDEIIQITGVEGSFISYAIEQNLTQENFDVAQKNIGLKFKNIKDAQKAVTEGIVFIGDKIYYINKGTATELFVLNEPIDSINNAGLGMPSKDLSVIIFKDGKWAYDQVVTLEYYNKYLKPKPSEDEEEYEEKEDPFDLIEYSKRYNLTKFEFQYEKTSEGKKIGSATFETSPSHDLQDGDICILSLRGYLANEDGTPIELAHNVFQEEAVVFQFKYEGGELKLIDKEGNPQEILLKNDSQGELQYFEYNGKTYTFIGNLQDTLDSRKNHLYVKAEESNPKKFKLDYQHAEIALEENYPKDQTTGKAKIIPHTVLGDLTDKAGYYNKTPIPFRTYSDRENTQGLYSDQAVFNGTEFRGEYPDETKNIQKAYNYPRYSKLLNTELCDNHKMEDIEDGDPFENVVPTIKWIKSNALKRPLKDINNTEFNTFEPESETYTNQDLNITVTIPNGIVYDSFQQKWRYEKIVPFNLFKTCCEFAITKIKELIEANKNFKVQWFILEGDSEPYTTTEVKNGTSATIPSSNPTRKGYNFIGWNYDDTPITKDTDIYAKWQKIIPKVYIEVSPSIVENTGGTVIVSYYAELDGEKILDGITVEGTYENISFEQVGEAYKENGKVNVELQIKQSTYNKRGKITFKASYQDATPSEVTLIQKIAGDISLPDFDLMKFSAEWTNTTTEDMTGVEGWTNSNGIWKYEGSGDLDIYTNTSGTNIQITDSKTLDDYGVGFVGDKSMSQISINSLATIIVRKNSTKIFDSSYNEITKESIENYNVDQGESNINKGKDVYDLFQYLSWSGDNTSSGGEYTVLNFKKIINNIVREGQKAVFIYMRVIWALTYNGTGDFNFKYNIYKLNDEEKGLVSPSRQYDFNLEDSSVQELEVTSNVLTGLHKDNRTGTESYTSLKDYKDPVATLYYDLNTQEITFMSRYETEESIYGSSTSSDSFIWTYFPIQETE